ncbi:MAG: phosphonate C-P lyase system protein PhnG [Rhodopseudomonas sp.]|uniref:phosphonate C-P lyase system protein PhnG n=1 Tax=Rhodopseudomonas sp. TaxID=1078 RepID=UPI0039E6FD89
MHAETQNSPEQAATARRRTAMAVLAASETTAIGARVDALTPPAFTLLREPEQGLVMLRGRIGGDGAAFNVGEATVSRAAVRLASGEVGFGYTLGRDRTKAKLIALCDALLQSADYSAAIETEVIAPLRTEVEAARAEKAARTAATKVDFYTLVRGEG